MEKTIGKKLHELRKQSGYTQDYVAEKLGANDKVLDTIEKVGKIGEALAEDKDE